MIQAPASMFDPMVKARREAKAAPRAMASWSSMTLEELIVYRDELSSELAKRGEASLATMNMETELLLQYSTLRRLQAAVLSDESVPANQKAQVANSVGSTQARLADLQMSVYSSERMKEIESALGKALDKLPEEAAAEFLAHYARILDAN